MSRPSTSAERCSPGYVLGPDHPDTRIIQDSTTALECRVRPESEESADYEKSGPTLRTPCLHGYHRAAPLIALIALYAQVTRSTNRSTPRQGDHRMPATERHHRLGLICRGYAGRSLKHESMHRSEQSGNIADT